jgi:hypothetical protein
MLCGSYTGGEGGRWWAVRAEVSSNDFDRKNWLLGWTVDGQASYSRSTLGDGDPGKYGILETYGSDESPRPALVAPVSYLGDWTWLGNCPTLISFSLKWLASAAPTEAPLLRITGPAGSAEVELADAGFTADALWHTFVVDLTEERWALSPGTDWHDLLRNVEKLEIFPALSGATGGKVGVDNLRLLRASHRSGFMEWKAASSDFDPVLGGARIRPADGATLSLVSWEQTGGDVPHPPGAGAAYSVRLPAFQNAGNGFQLYLDGLGPNGGKRFLSNDTFIREAPDLRRFCRVVSLLQPGL